MKIWQTKLPFRLPQPVPGEWLLVSLLTSCVVLLTGHSLKSGAGLLLVSLSCYLICILLVRQGHLVLFLLPVIILLLNLGNNYRFQQQKPPESTIYQVRADQISIVNDFVSCPGVVPQSRQKVLINFAQTPKTAAIISQQQNIWIKVTKPDIQKIPSATNLGQFDLQKFYQRQDIKYQVKAQEVQVAVVKPTVSNQLIHWRAKLKNYLMALPQNLRFFAGQLILGENLARENRELLNNFRGLGIIHLLSLSGLHVVIYVAIFNLLGNALKISPRIRQLAIVLLLLVVCFLGNWQAGLVRATLAYLLSAQMRKTKIWLQPLDLYGMTLVLHQLLVPNLLLNVGAQLSYLLVLGLKLTTKENKFRQSLFLNILILPVLVTNFFEVNIFTIFYNLLAVPIFEYFVMPVTFLGVLLSTSSQVAVAIAESLLGIFNMVLGNLNYWQLGNLVTGTFPVVTELILLLLSLISYIYRKQPKFCHYCCLAAVLLFGGSCFWNWFKPIGQVTFIDVGQGDSILIITPFKKKTILVDTGGKLSFGKQTPTTKQAEQITIPFLKRQGISQLDAVFVSHQDADHIGDLVKLGQQMKIKKLYFQQGMQQNPSFRQKLQKLAPTTKLVPVLAKQSYQLENLNLQILHPEKPGLGTNEDSLTLLVTVAHKRWLFSGDLDQAGEEEIVRNYPNLTVDYLKLGHHGSKTSSSPKFLKQVTPKLAIISAGRNNRYGHPHLETLATLQQLKIPTVSTAEYGMINWYFGPQQVAHFETFKTQVSR